MEANATIDSSDSLTAEVQEEHPKTSNASKPIKKREIINEDDQDMDEDLDAHDKTDQMNDVASRARIELNDFLSGKGIDPIHSQDYQINVRINKKRRSLRGSESSGFAVTFTGPDGSFLPSKTDVLNSVRQYLQSKAAAQSANVAAQKLETHNEMNAKVEEITLPCEIGGKTVHAFGVVSPQPGFHSSVQLYPIGYKSEFTIDHGASPRGSSSTKVTVVCEILCAEGGIPQFCIKTPSQSFVALSEAAAWKKVHDTVDLNLLINIRLV